MDVFANSLRLKKSIALLIKRRLDEYDDLYVLRVCMFYPPGILTWPLNN